MPDEITVQECARVVLEAFRRISQRGQAFGYDRNSLAWVENYIESNRDKFSAVESQSLIGLVGAYLGECVRRMYGGNWKEKDGAWGIFFDERGAAFPFTKARRLMEDGLAAGQSMTSFFDVLPIILKGN